MNKTKIVKELTLKSWKELGAARRGLIARNFAAKVVDSDLTTEQKSILLEKITTIGFVLKTLSKEGYGYNSSSEAHYDRDHAGKLSVNNKKGVWIYEGIG